MVDKITGEILPEGEITNIGSEMYENNEPPEFTVDVFEDVGRAVLAGILDLHDANPLSRLPKSQFKNLEGVQKSVEKYVDETWGLDKKPEPQDDKRPAHSLPRVALLGPKKKAKTFEEKCKEMQEQKEKDRQRLDRIRNDYLKEFKQRREKEIVDRNSCSSPSNPETLSFSNMPSINKTNSAQDSTPTRHSDQVSTSYQTYIDNYGDMYDPYRNSYGGNKSP